MMRYIGFHIVNWEWKFETNALSQEIYLSNNLYTLYFVFDDLEVKWLRKQ